MLTSNRLYCSSVLAPWYVPFAGGAERMDIFPDPQMQIERRGKIMSLIPVLKMACGERLGSRNDGPCAYWPLVGCIPALVSG
jgi:hypothetical protein